MNRRVFLCSFLGWYMLFSWLHAVDQLQVSVDEALDVQKALVSPLGKNRAAQLGSWCSTGFLIALGSFLGYKTCERVFDSGLGYIPFLRSYHEEIARTATLMMVLPASIVASMKYGSLAHYFFYILYAGERVSPLLARDALHDVRVYVEHLQAIKAVQKELYDVIDYINMLSTQEKNSQKNEQKHESNVVVFDIHVLEQLNEAIKHDDEYVQTILLQLQLFLSPEEIHQFVQELSLRGAVKAYSVASELQGQTQSIMAHMQMTVQSLGDDAVLLNNLMKGLVDYWQNYTVALASGIDVALRFCNEVHMLEQVITKWFDRSLLCA